jgi:hypothetical protein
MTARNQDNISHYFVSIIPSNDNFTLVTIGAHPSPNSRLKSQINTFLVLLNVSKLKNLCEFFNFVMKCKPRMYSLVPNKLDEDMGSIG